MNLHQRQPVEIDPHDPVLLEQIGRLRVCAWATFKEVATECWLDEFELSARHWVIFDNGQPIAAARLSIHQTLDDVPDASIYEGIFDQPPSGPIALFNRLVVHPAHRGAALSRLFDQVRIAAAIESGCRSVIVQTNSGPSRVAQLHALGFRDVGPGHPYPPGHFYYNCNGSFFLLDLTASPSHGIRQTANRMGWSTDVLSEVSTAFVQAAAEATHAVLDIGAAYGVATIAALEAGATVVANDLDVHHLDELLARTAPHLQPRLTTVPGRFPDGLSFPMESFDAIHCSQVLHFLTPDEVVAALDRAFQWLRPGGKLFVVAATPYQATHRAFVTEFLRRKARGARWPGVINPLRDYNHHWSASLNPSWLHVFDEEILAAAVRDAGFDVDSARLFSRDGLPDFCRLDGRENLALIATKPCETRLRRVSVTPVEEGGPCFTSSVA
jgi:SAM-dependent methyltransferase